MYRSILVPLDGSLFAEHALPLAMGIARRSQATLHLIHVHDPCDDRLLTYYTLDPAVERSERAYLAGLARRLAAVSGLSICTAVVGGEVTGSLQEQARRREAELVVMTTHGRGPLSAFWLGSVSEQLIGLLSVPLLLVRPQAVVPSLENEPELKRILIPLDGGELAEQVLEPALDLGALTGAAYTLLRVERSVPEYRIDVPGAAWQQWEAARSYLDAVARRLRARSLTVQTCVVADTRIAAAILVAARAAGADAIALATHGRAGVQRLLLGSVADKVLREAMAPVLVYHPAAVLLRAVP
jgi:nucleotide-binding universal stress UspA family protein